MKKLTALFLSIIMCMTFLPQAHSYADSGEEGERYVRSQEEAAETPEDDSGTDNGVQWDFDGETGTMTFTGEGVFPYSQVVYSPDRPWQKYRAQIKHIVFDEGFTEIGKFAVQNIAHVETITLPSTLRVIGNNAFSLCGDLKEIVIPDGVTTIGGAAFQGCAALERVIMPDSVTKFSGTGTFSECSSLKEVRLSASLERLPGSAFRDCTSLETLYLTDSIMEIESGCFAGCEALTITHLPEQLTVIGGYVFEKCNFSEDCTLPPHLTDIGIAGLPVSWVKTQKYVLTESGLLYSYQISFGGVKEKNVILPDGVRSIAPYVFTYGTYAVIENKYPYINNVTIPSSVTDIHEYAFLNCHLSGICGYFGSYAQEYALAHNLKFTALDEAAEAVKPLFGERTLSISNTSNVFSTGYALNAWHELILREFNGSNPTAVKEEDEEWEGSCFGLAVLQILLDSGTIAPAALGAETIADIQPTADNLSFINCLHHVGNFPTMIGAYSDQVNETQKKILARAVVAAQHVNAGAAPFLINIRTKTGMHAIVGYGVEEGEWTWDGFDYDHRVLLWDSNHIDGGDAVQLYYRNQVWCIPAYGLTNRVSGEGELLYVVEDIPTLFSYLAERVQPLPGDVNGDAALSIADAVLMSRYLAEDAAVSKASGRYNADSSADGTADLDDLLYILRALSA